MQDFELNKRAAESLSAMVQFETVSTPDKDDNESDLIRFHEYLASRYPLVHSVMKLEIVNRLSLLYFWQAPVVTGKPVLFCAHMDVVPATGSWNHEPFSGDIVNGYVHGRGTQDCKNVLVVLMETAEKLLKEGFVPTRDIYFAFGHDEETGGQKGARCISELLSERGIQLDLVLDEGGYIDADKPYHEKKTATICVSEKGFMNIHLIARSAGGHSSAPPRQTALGKICEAVYRIEHHPIKARLHPVVYEGMRLRIGRYSRSYRLLIKHAWLLKPFLLKKMSKNGQNAAVRTTIAATMAEAGKAANVLPQYAHITCNCRLCHGDTCESVLNRIKKQCSDLDIEVSSTDQREASSVSEYRKIEMYAYLSDIIKKVFGNVMVVPAIATGGTDARKYERVCRHVYRFVPFNGENIHKSNEKVAVDMLGKAIEFYSQLITALAGGQH